jgi:transcriptional regulator with PAS, ATPase and Fis domain
MARVHGELAAVVGAPVPVLLAGETGVGKEHLAHLIHDSSPRAGAPFEAVNCAAIPADLLEAELFGVQDGAATGVRQRPGSFRAASGGTLFLDEVAEMEPRLQAKLLRVLQEREVRPVGGRPVAVDVRVVSATNVDIARRRRDGTLRDDLYYRLAGYVVRVPPLRQRREDLPELIEHFMLRFADEARKRLLGIEPAALETLTAYPWPGNVRQLAHEVRRLVYLAPDGGRLRAADLSREVAAGEAAEPLPAGPETVDGMEAGGDLDLAAHVERLECRLIRRALLRSGGGIAPAARLLGLSRNGFKAKCRRHGIRL